jgi:hypothetical protein
MSEVRFGSWADADARLAELRERQGVSSTRLVQLPALNADELLRLRWAVHLGMATALENPEQLGERMLVVLGSLDTAIAEAYHSIR